MSEYTASYSQGKDSGGGYWEDYHADTAREALNLAVANVGTWSDWVDDEGRNNREDVNVVVTLCGEGIRRTVTLVAA